ncbi:transcriptional regulator [Aliidiomarina taiwanensis]|uniref:Transcriptional regulator n=1 Tax=Aliidiomarina taiwanensis TaxID=946228 RepID=A0A432X9V0_9GAMM|nr:ChrR family anti-sigma-E factor [Aliidiomarina taiwanensis]RUO44011.1 transcriptional regulator [Aliidiomarina taiwanensis]
MKIKYHPTDELIEHFTAGILSPALSVLVSTHLDLCPRCQQVNLEVEESLAEQLITTSPAGVNTADYDQMLEHIFNSPAPVQQPQRQSLHSLRVNGKTFVLPPTLARQYQRIGQWSRIPGKMFKAPVQLGSDECIHLIYMDKGSRVPEHTHKGNEVTLVINGVFNDEQDEYRDGDFVMLDQQHKHQPQTQSHDCLTLATLDAPLLFTAGLPRLLNPFSSLFFK